MSSSKKVLPVLAFSFGFICVIVAISVIAVYASPDYCGKLYISGKGQTSCNYSADHPYVTLKVNIPETASDVTTYIFTKQPKRVYVNEPFNFTVNNKMYASFVIPSDVSNKVSYTLDMNAKINLQYIGKNGKKTEVIYSKQNVQTDEGSFIIDKSFNDCHFVLTSTDYFSGSFDVAVGLRQYDVNSVTPTEKCKSYPCEWDLTDPRLMYKDIYIVNDNVGFESYNIRAELYYNLTLYIIIGLIILAIGLIGIVGTVVFYFVFKK